MNLRATPSVPLLIASGVCLGLAATACALSAEWNAELHDLDSPAIKTRQDVYDLGYRTNGAVATTVGFGAASGVLLVAGFYEVRF